MPVWTQILVGLIALEHLWILVLEMFLWDKPQGMKTFNTTPESAAQTKVLAGNQGLYNGFLAMGLLWSYGRCFPSASPARPNHLPPSFCSASSPPVFMVR